MGAEKKKVSERTKTGGIVTFFLIVLIFNHDSDDFFSSPPRTRLCSTDSSLRSFTCRCQNAPKPSCPPQKKPQPTLNHKVFLLKTAETGKMWPQTTKEGQKREQKAPKQEKKEPKRLVLGWGGDANTPPPPIKLEAGVGEGERVRGVPGGTAPPPPSSLSSLW